MPEQPLTEEIKQAERLKVQEELNERLKNEGHIVQYIDDEIFYHGEFIKKIIQDITK